MYRWFASRGIKLLYKKLNYDIIKIYLLFFRERDIVMSAILSDNVKTFADTASQLYNVFFKKYPMLKILALNAIFNSSGNFALLLMDKDKVVGNYTVYTSNEGNIIKNGIDSKTNVCFRIQKSLMEDVLVNKEEYINKPYRLFKFIPGVLKSMSIKKEVEEENCLVGNKTILKQGTEKDIIHLVKWYNDEELNKLAGWTEGKLGAWQLKQNISKGFGYDPMNLMIYTKDDKPIGTIQLYDFNELNRCCKLGIRIGEREFWGKGYGEDAIRALIKFAFYKLDIYRVSLKLYEYNKRASRCYLKCGFKYEGRTRKSAFIDGQFYDEILMGILKRDFIQ